MSTVGSPPPVGKFSTTASPPRRAARVQTGDDNSVKAAQAEVQAKVNEVQDQLKRVEQEGEASVNQLKETYEQQSVGESAREETQYAAEQLKGYERIRDLQRSQAAELARVKRQGEDQLAQLNNYYRNTTQSTESRSDEQLRQLQHHNDERLAFERKTGETMSDQVRSETRTEVGRLQNERDYKMTALEQQAHEAYEKKKEETDNAIAKTSEKLDQNYQDISKTHQDTVDHLNIRSTEDLKRLQLESSRKLNAFNERQEDPFYQMLDMQAELEDQGDKYVLTAKIPEHEQHHVSIAVRGNQIVLSGTRRNEDKVELEPGHVRGTNSYQSFMESFPVSQPVEAAKVSHEFDGDQVVVTVPKKILAQGYKPHPKAQPKRLAASKPDFPANLPHVSNEPSSAGEVTATQGSGTLSKNNA